ncbi:hypothetical protein ACQWHR_24375, partial [Salmonella enterica subsp. enterica serovar Infantis]
SVSLYLGFCFFFVDIVGVSWRVFLVLSVIFPVWGAGCLFCVFFGGGVVFFVFSGGGPGRVLKERTPE